MDAIETGRLVLRNFAADDAADLFAYLHRPRASCFSHERLDDLAAAEKEATSRGASDQHVAVRLRETGRLIGVFEEPDTCSVGWNVSADVAGAGFAHEAARASFAHLFSARAARRLYAYVEENNAPSRRLCERLGMPPEGLFVEFVSFVDDETGAPIFENTMQYAILRREWDAGRRV